MKLKSALAILAAFVAMGPSRQQGGGQTDSGNNTSKNPLLPMFAANAQYQTPWNPVQVSTTNNKTLPNQPTPTWDTELEVDGTPSGNAPTPNPLNTQPEPFFVHNMTMTLRNFDQNLLDILFMQSQRFNNSLNETQLFSLNNRVYAFSWRNGLFDRLPFPTNSTFPYNTTEDKDCAIVLTPLKNRFAARPVLDRQMECALHARVLEHNHYIGKFNRIIVQFFSPCMEYPIYRYFLHKAGLRRMLALRIHDQLFRFEFSASFRTSIGSSQVESFRLYRHLQPHHHQAWFVGPKYRADNRTNHTAQINNRQVTPQQLFAMQAVVLDRLDQEYERRSNLTDGQNQDRDWTPRNERFPRKAKNAAKKAKKKKKKSEKKATKRRTKDGKSPHHAHLTGSPKDFRFSAAATKKNRVLAAKMVGGEENLNRFLQHNFNDWNVNPGSPGNQYNNRAGWLWWPIEESRQAPYRRNWYGLGDGNFNNNLMPFLRTIRANEPYKVATCQRICTMADYYHSWNFCLRVCGVDYNYLSNIRPITGHRDFFGNVPWRRVASQLFPLVRRRKGLYNQWTRTQLQALWDQPQVATCTQTWSRFTCTLV